MLEHSNAETIKTSWRCSDKVQERKLLPIATNIPPSSQKKSSPCGNPSSLSSCLWLLVFHRPNQWVHIELDLQFQVPNRRGDEWRWASPAMVKQVGSSDFSRLWAVQLNIHIEYTSNKTKEPVDNWGSFTSKVGSSCSTSQSPCHIHPKISLHLRFGQIEQGLQNQLGVI